MLKHFREFRDGGDQGPLVSLHGLAINLSRSKKKKKRNHQKHNYAYPHPPASPSSEQKVDPPPFLPLPPPQPYPGAPGAWYNSFCSIEQTWWPFEPASLPCWTVVGSRLCCAQDAAPAGPSKPRRLRLGGNHTKKDLGPPRVPGDRGAS